MTHSYVCLMLIVLSFGFVCLIVLLSVGFMIFYMVYSV